MEKSKTPNFWQVSNFVGKLFHAPHCPRNKNAPYWTVPWQLPATPLRRYVAAPLPCHATDGVHELRRCRQRQQPPVAKYAGGKYR